MITRVQFIESLNSLLHQQPINVVPHKRTKIMFGQDKVRCTVIVGTQLLVLPSPVIYLRFHVFDAGELFEIEQEMTIRLVNPTNAHIIEQTKPDEDWITIFRLPPAGQYNLDVVWYPK